jgi:glutamine transport system substrate-binding protein
MAGITITDARKQVVDFSDGYYDADLLMAVKSGDNSITKFSELAGKKVGLKQGTAAASFMKSKYKADYVEFPILITPISTCRQAIWMRSFTTPRTCSTT